MESEKVKEIKKGLECWQESVMLSTDENYVSHKVYNREILDYINELESENEQLRQELKDYPIMYDICNEREYRKKFNDEWRKEYQKELDKQGKGHIAGFPDFDLVYKLYFEQKDRIAELQKEKICVWEEWTDGDHSIWCCSNCKEDFCFMEGDVYENNYGYCPHCGAKITALKELKEDDIDETLKEVIE